MATLKREDSAKRGAGRVNYHNRLSANASWSSHSRARQAGRKAADVGRKRLSIIGGVIAVCYLALAGQLVNVSALKGGNGDSEIGGQQIALAGELEKNRRDIVDRNGVLLATTLPVDGLVARPKAFRNKDAIADAARRLASVLSGVSEQTLYHRLTRKGWEVRLKHQITPQEKQAVIELGIPGVYFSKSERRFYPQGKLFSHVLGYVDRDGAGKAGLERELEERLAGKENAAQGPLTLSLDVAVQHAVAARLKESMDEFQAKWAAGVVLDVKTGEVVSMVSLPDYNPHRYNVEPQKSLFNHASQGVYELGSTFKLFTAAMALESHRYGLGSWIDASKPLKVGRFTIRDDHAKNRAMTLPEMVTFSSNIAAARVADDLGEDFVKDYLAKLGLTEALPLEMSGLGRPLVPDHWRRTNLMTIAYGHGISVSPVHLAPAIAALVNGGTYYTPTLLKRPDDGLLKGEKVFSKRTSDYLRGMMRMVVEKGTGGKADAVGYMVGGKTGTAEMAVAGGYDRNALVTTFGSAFPMDDPKYVVIATLGQPQGTKETFGFASAGWTAAPTVGGIVSRIAPLLGVRPVTDQREAKNPAIRMASYVTVDKKH